VAPKEVIKYHNCTNIPAKNLQGNKMISFLTYILWSTCNLSAHFLQHKFAFDWYSLGHKYMLMTNNGPNTIDKESNTKGEGI
jgi:hypothetical protein